jgi:release factor glutamine methyltransferase
MTIQQASQQLLFQLYHIYEEREARNIADLVMENITEWHRIDRLMNKEVPLSQPKEQLLQQYITELMEHKPVQYVLKEAWFSGMKLYVDPSVLIPRPETEELVNWVTTDLRLPIADMKVIDIGTGSGCIPIALKKKLTDATIYACDISEEALEVAGKNADNQQTDIRLLQCDFLNKEERNHLPEVDVVVSNPPYIPVNEKSLIPENVTRHEPHIALFVSDDDPLQFYMAIADFARYRLSRNGSVYVEIHEDLCVAVRELFSKKGFKKIEVKKDMQDKNRMVKASQMSYDL